MATSTMLSSAPLDFSASFKDPPQQPRQMPRQQRPKLSLNTAVQHRRSLGKNSTNLGAEALASGSPTVRNTYKNCWDGQNDASAVEPPRLHSGWFQREKGFSSIQVKTEQDRPVASPRATELSLTPNQPVPYTPTTHIRSILTNGPHSKRPSPDTAPISVFAHSHQPSASPSKSVNFRDPLAEEISTSTYVLKHSDLRSRTPSPNPAAKRRRAPVPKHRETAPARQATQPEDEYEDEEEEEKVEQGGHLPKTPVAGRHKKHKEWVWTLGPIPHVQGPGQAIPETSQPSQEDLDDSLEETVAAASGFAASPR